MTDAALVVDALSIALLALALVAIVVLDLEASVWLLAAQSSLLALVTVTLAVATGAGHLWIAAGLAILVRAVIGPAVLLAVIRSAGRPRESRLIVSRHLAFAIALLLVSAAFHVAGGLELPEALPAQRALPASLSLALIGVLLMSTRRLVVSQLVGLITIENGVYLAGLATTLGLPLFVELGVFFDLLVALAVTAVLALRIREHFASVSSDEMRGLRG